LENGYNFSNIIVKEGNFYFYHKYNYYIKSITCNNRELKKFYDSFIKHKNSGIYKIFYGVIDNGNTRKFSINVKKD